MNAQKTEHTVSTEPKPALLDRIKQSNIPARAKNIAAVVGVVTVVGVAVAAVLKVKSAGVEVTLPDVDLTLVEA